MTRLLGIVGLLLLCGCPDAAQSSDPAVTADESPVGGCLDRPSELPRPPTGVLPCELIPPTLSLNSGQLRPAARAQEKH